MNMKMNIQSHNSVLTVDLAALRENARAILRSLEGAQLIPVLKDDAYGLGAAVRSSKALSAQPGGRARTWHLGFDASWELDLLGGTRRLCQLRRRAGSAAGDREISRDGGLRLEGQRPAHDQDLPVDARRAEGQALAHMRDRKQEDLRETAELRGDPRRPEAVGVVLEHRDELRPLQALQDRAHIFPQRGKIHAEDGVVSLYIRFRIHSFSL